MSSKHTVTFQRAEKKREELLLPILHYVVVDDWIEKIGADAFISWLRFHTWCDRSDERKDKENDVIPSSLTKVMKRLGMGRKKFYNSVIKPLWNYGLIDLVEYDDSSQKGTKPINIVVYEYPQNNIFLATKKLEKIRDYDLDYNSESRGFAKTGGRPKKNPEEEIEQSFGGFPQETGGVSHRNPGGFPQKHNNVSNILNNGSNILNNDSNDLYQYLSDYLFQCKLPMRLKKFFSIRISVLINKFPSFDIEKIEYVYNTYTEWINPDVSRDNEWLLNDIEFSDMIIRMYKALSGEKTDANGKELIHDINPEPIQNMEGLIRKWIERGIEFKRQRKLNASSFLKYYDED